MSKLNYEEGHDERLMARRRQLQQDVTRLQNECDNYQDRCGPVCLLHPKHTLNDLTFFHKLSRNLSSSQYSAQSGIENSISL